MPVERGERPHLLTLRLFLTAAKKLRTASLVRERDPATAFPAQTEAHSEHPSHVAYMVITSQSYPDACCL